MKSADEKYELEMPEKAVARNEERLGSRHPCCWESLDAPHHPLCKNASESEEGEQVPGQESLL